MGKIKQVIVKALDIAVTIYIIVYLRAMHVMAHIQNGTHNAWQDYPEIKFVVLTIPIAILSVAWASYMITRYFPNLTNKLIELHRISPVVISLLALLAVLIIKAIYAVFA